ncbi:hypothetical protein BDZ88DRAFT_456353 [Geranomyces variabilis]|nr:hypothetical protein BDZ88DRAFT_456353 [Geranomyces variabilis]
MSEAHGIIVSKNEAVPVEPLNYAAERLQVLERDRRRIEDKMATLRGGLEDGTRTESGTTSCIGDELSPQEMKAAHMRRHKNMFSVLPKYDGAADVSKLHEFTELHGKYLIATRMFLNEEVREHLPFYLIRLAGQWFRRLEQQGELTNVTRLAEDARIAGGTDPIPASDMLKMFLDGYERGGAIGRDIRNALMAKRAFEADITMDSLMTGADSLAQMMGLVNTKRKRNGDDVRPDSGVAEAQCAYAALEVAGTV